MQARTTPSPCSAVQLLWRKSILLNMWSLVFYAVFVTVYLGFWAHTSDRPLSYLVIGSLIVALLPMATLTKEHKPGGIRLTCSLPVTRQAIVAANLSLAWLLAFIGVLVMFGLPLIPGVGRTESGHLLTGGNVLLVLAVLTLTSLFIHPALIRFGPIGLVLGLAAMQVLGTVMVVLTATGVIRGGLGGLIGGIHSSVHGLRHALGDVGFSCALIGALVFINAVTFALSLRLYRRLEA